MKTTLNALAESNRLHIVELLRDGPLTVGEIAERLGLNQPQASKHLRVLNNAGLVEVQAMANRRIYKLRAEPFKEIDEWLKSYRHIWNERFDRLDEYLQDLQGKEVNHDD
ncbi:ArsR/SmtB family transcription factor [Metabacillus sediminilitoris]|uniref:Winged helix-turn-helix transcriptional regulator n=2 Tax=Metabacillus sediminilitoris TaxID=2567941 RepID=A0A4V3WEK2_9BACI|nr:metalloregulator ArsR/SmtB family transcription factor [Metabacillus sediminilitoris]QGQ48687.1 metalloregulator ArsR/SmtB family transcription factor [Metabacillus sediminilitoris]THF76662.1 winged helix-turn-helix transcriptional regulator [Metabacillus sediminilitoris]